MENDTPKTALEMQIEQEKKELEVVPKVPIQQFLGSHGRCHFCGQLEHPEEMKRIHGIHPSIRPRLMCRRCSGG